MPASESLLLLLMLCRFGQGVGLGGEWGGAVLLSRTLRQACLVRYVSQLVHQLVCYFLVELLILTDTMSSQDFLIMVGGFLYSEFVGSSRFLYPIKITETPAFENSKKEQEEVKIRFSPTEIL
jgi:hypothetical protein